MIELPMTDADSGTEGTLDTLKERGGLGADALAEDIFVEYTADPRATVGVGGDAE